MRLFGDDPMLYVRPCHSFLSYIIFVLQTFFQLIPGIDFLSVRFCVGNIGCHLLFDLAF